MVALVLKFEYHLRGVGAIARRVSVSMRSRSRPLAIANPQDQGMMMIPGNITKNQQGKPAKRRNHTVPKALLKRWLTEVDGTVGHWVLDCDTGQIAFKPGAGASFAISEFRYVPVRAPNGQTPYRDETVEDWFSQGENDLALITGLLLNGQSLENRGDTVGGFIQAAILLGFRSAYEYEAFERVLISVAPSLADDEIARRVVDHFRSAYSRKLKQFANWDYQVVPSPSESLLVCDRPMFDMTVHRLGQEMLVIPLAPSLMLVASPPSNRSRKILSFTVSDKTSSKVVTLANRFTVERARQFIVGHPDQLKEVQPAFAALAFQARKATDQFVVEGTASSERVPISEF